MPRLSARHFFRTIYIDFCYLCANISESGPAIFIKSHSVPPLGNVVIALPNSSSSHWNSCANQHLNIKGIIYSENKGTMENIYWYILWPEKRCFNLEDSTPEAEKIHLKKLLVIHYDTISSVMTSLPPLSTETHFLVHL